MAFDREIFATPLRATIFLDIADRIYRHGQPIDPFAVGHIRAGSCWLEWGQHSGTLSHRAVHKKGQGKVNMIWPFLSGGCRSGFHNEIKVTKTIKSKGGGGLMRLPSGNQMGERIAPQLAQP